uniref:Uncharacterized protein n=2 Tax=Oryza rufipogon TaxID=4529 RepID=A0A0E0QGV1_ORYRU
MNPAASVLGSALATQIRNDGDGGCNDDDSGDGSCDDDDGDDSGCDENDNAVMQVAAVLSSSILRHQQHQYTLGRLPTLIDKILLGAAKLTWKILVTRHRVKFCMVTFNWVVDSGL